ncbi:MAG: hypothetical protein ABJB16_15045 [Saprospiraceae bacterium]
MKTLKDIFTKAPDTIPKSEANDKLIIWQNQLYSLQNLLYAEKKHSLLIVLQDNGCGR